ncbi:MAG: LysR family transcriptional regulator [Clostridia bacterium]|nr:LysR family transcriptional regulator [Clostridia bacterium]
MNEMDYVYEVYKERSFSAAARKLFVSQPALSTAIRKLEESLGIVIFDRSISPISLTEAGKVYIAAVEEIRAIERRAMEEIADMSELRIGHLTVSGENFVASFIMPRVMKRFFGKYGGIDVDLVESNSPDLRKLLLTDQIDLLIAHDFDARLYTAHPLFEESLLLAVPESFAINAKLRDFGGKNYVLTREMVCAGEHLKSGCPAVDLRLFENEPFLLLKPGNDMYRRAGILCEDAGFTPKKRLELDQLISSYNMALAGMGVAFVTDVLVSAAPGEGCVYYRLSGAHTTRTMSIGYKKGRYLSRACLAFIGTAKEVFEKE